jgi:hypothetical protein
MLVTVGDIHTKVRGFIVDEDSTGYRWSNLKLTDYLNQIALELVRIRSDANPVRAAIQLTAGGSHHDILPADAIFLDDITSNMGVDGLTVGDALTEASLEEMDRFNRGWRTATAAASISQWLRHPSEDVAFYTYPPAHAVTAVYLELIYRKVPDRMILQEFSPGDVVQAADQIALGGHGLTTDFKITFSNVGGALPAPLTARTVYYVRVVDADTIEVSLTAGGAAIDITDQGTGTHTLDSVLTVNAKYQWPLQAGTAGSALIEEQEHANPEAGRGYMDIFYKSLGADPPDVQPKEG